MLLHCSTAPLVNELLETLLQLDKDNAETLKPLSNYL